MKKKKENKMYDTIYRYLELLAQHASIVTDPNRIIPTLYFTQHPLYVDTIDATKPAPVGVEHSLRSLHDEPVGCIVHYDLQGKSYSIATPTIREPYVLPNKARAAELLVKWAEKNHYVTITEVDQSRRTEKVLVQHKYHDSTSIPAWLVYFAVGLVLLCACIFMFRFYSAPNIKETNNVVVPREAISNTGHQRSADVIDASACCQDGSQCNGE